MSSNIIGFLDITAHYIDSDWNLKDVLVDFVYLAESHSGENLAQAFVKSLQDKKILIKASDKFIFTLYNKFNKLITYY